MTCDAVPMGACKRISFAYGTNRAGSLSTQLWAADGSFSGLLCCPPLLTSFCGQPDVLICNTCMKLNGWI